MSSGGKFITFEGGEGSGKSTQGLFLKSFLEQKNLKVLLTREPGGSAGAELIRTLLLEGSLKRWDAMSEYLLLSAGRRDHLETTIKPALARGEWVISDRFFESSLVYQGYGRGLDLTFIETLYTTIAGGLRPDLTLIFDLPPALGLKRLKKRSQEKDRFEQMDFAFHERIRQGYLTIADQDPEHYPLVNACEEEEKVAFKIQALIEHSFFKG